MEQSLSRHEKRELKKQMRAANLASLGRKQTITSFLWWGAFIVVLGGLIFYIVWDIMRPLSGVEVDILDRNHVPEDQHPTYNSNPPTSGSHYGQTEDWGISDRPLVIEKLVHNMEHGGVIIFYNCKDCDELVNKLKDLTQRLAKKDRKIILTPYDKIDSKIAISSWGFYDKIEEFDEERLAEFFNDHINKGPERVF